MKSEHASKLAGVGHWSHWGMRNRVELHVPGPKGVPAQPDVGCLVALHIAVVGSTEDGHTLSIVGLLVAVYFHLVRPNQPV